MRNGSVYELDGVPPIGSSVAAGIQHVLAMFVGNVTPLIIIAGAGGLSPEETSLLIQCSLFISGITTLLQCYNLGPIGARLPIVMGTSFAFVSVGCAIVSQYGMDALLGATIVATLFQAALAFVITPMAKFFPPVVTGCVVLMIGLNLIPVGMDYFAGGNGSPEYGSMQNIALASLVFLIVVGLTIFGKGIFKLSAVLIGLVVGYIIAIPMGLVNFETVEQAAWFAIPRPFAFGIEFVPAAIIPMCLIVIASAVETFGNVSAITQRCLDREPTKKEIRGALLADSLASCVGGFFNVTPNTAFGQNIGILTMTKVINRFAIATGAIFLIICGFLPKLSALIQAIPQSVLGGACVVLFAMIFVSGFSMIAKDGLDEKKSLIVAISIGLGLGISSRPAALANFPEGLQLVLSSGVIVALVAAFILNIIIPEPKVESAK